MYTEDFIYGPLTFKQFICAAIGAGICYFINLNAPEDYKIVGIILIVALTVLGIVRLKPEKITNVEEYFRKKKTELGTEGYKRMLNMRQAVVTSQISLRKMKGQSENPELLVVSNILKKLIEDSNEQ